ncbi:beta-glucosidase [Mycetocola sp. BIGb0189]|uniref:glycoside hydrolase family 3 C-terminal domain-containing protein n=1 Tax=Mycetocola sp. BIGb0189 TaxID=2940604 RepID=UPI002169B6AE|nr:glycoside hydrolase family 3 C-terminal domain-containing protein [Mycetocola sp. BIGb0189]MCS4275945.1 beta-glucosidase [Mycetocola sp. BIGb0189]
MSQHPQTESILAGLTLEQKASLLSGATFWETEGIEDAGVPSIIVSDGPHGVRRQSTGGDHLGLLDGEPATCFPPAVGLGSSWDPELVERVGEALGREAQAKRVSVLLGPGINIKRDPRCGRNFEYLSEDPLHAGVLGSAFVRGVQSQGVGTSLKHYAANNQETDRLRVSAEIDTRTLRELYLPAFRRVVTETQPWTVMCSYNKINGTFASEHNWLLNTVLRDEWGFEGVVVSDWGAVRDRVPSLAAGLDLEMPTTVGRTDAEVVAAVKDGSLDIAVVDTAARRLIDLALSGQQGLWENAELDVDGQHALAREIAGRSIVLLRNEDAILPLTPGAGPVAVIGEFARTPRYQGAGSSQIVPTRLDNALDAIREISGEDVPFAAGFTLDGVADAALADEAVRVAASAETVLYFAGLPSSAESEGFDRDDIELPADQVALLERLIEANPRIVVVLSNGAVVRVSDWNERVPALVEGWLLGQAGGGAIADVLYGAVNPSGRLTESIPERLQDVPAFTSFPGEQGSVRYAEGLYVGYRHYDTREAAVSYPFGFGLSYTSFSYDHTAVRVDEDTVHVSVQVTNTGKRDGREVVQVYTGLPGAEVSRPVHELRAFASVEVPAGETREVALSFPISELAYFAPVADAWSVEGGTYVVEIAASSRDIRASLEIQIEGDPSPIPLSINSTLGEWLAHPIGAPILNAALAEVLASTPAVGAMLNDPHMRKMAEQMPMTQAVSFGAVTTEQVQALVAAVEQASA